MEAEFTPDPAKEVRINGLEATLCTCLVTGRRKKSFLLHMRSASRRHFIRNTLSVVCEAVRGANLVRSRKPSGSTKCKPCMRDRHGTSNLCLGCTGRLMRRKSTCCYFYSGRHLRSLGARISRNKMRVSICSGRYLDLDGRRMRTGLTTNGP